MGGSIELFGAEKRIAQKNTVTFTLTGNFKGYRDCHVKPDLVLVYKLHDDEIELHHLKTHSELFG